MSELQSLRRIMNSHAIVRRLSIEELAAANRKGARESKHYRSEAMSRLNRVTARYQRSIRALHMHMWRNGMTEVVPAGVYAVGDYGEMLHEQRPAILDSRQKAIQELRMRGITRDQARKICGQADRWGQICLRRHCTIIAAVRLDACAASQSHGR